MMSVTAIIQGAQAQHWGRSLGLGPPHHVPLGNYCFLWTLSAYNLEQQIRKKHLVSFTATVMYKFTHR